MKGPAMPITPAFRTALISAAAGVFLFAAGVANSGAHRTVGLAAAATGALLLAVAFPRLWSALPGLPTGRIDPPIVNPGRAAPPAPPAPPAVGPAVPLFADPPTPAIPDGIDPETGELVPDNLELARRLERLAGVVAEQSELVAAALVELKASHG
jgi:hypothetical protein